MSERSADVSRLDRVPGGRRLADAAPTLAIAAVAGVAGVAGSFALAGFTPSFVGGPIAGFLARTMPGAVITFAIVVLGDLGKQLNLLSALGIAAGLLATAAGVGSFAARRADLPGVGTLTAGALAGAVSFAVTSALVPSLGAATGVGLVVLLAELSPMAPVGESAARRRLLGAVAGGLTVSAGGAVLGRTGETHGATVDAGTVGNTEAFDMPVSSLVAEADEKSLPVEGLEPLISENFYTVDINATNPAIDADEWTLSVTGEVEEEIEYTFDEIREMDAENRVVSLRCVGESLNGKKLDNAVWTGVPIADLVEPAGVPDGCCVMLRADDDFFEEFPLAALRDSLLAYGMNGTSLPRAHGYPARALIPGRWGEVNVKWLTEIEILAEPADGYWENRGWMGTGPVNTVAKLRAQNELADGRIEVAGRAYAGTRGIERVEVSTDGGETWTDATLSEELPSDDALRQWVYRYDPPDDTHEVVVRATDGEGTLQPREQSNAFPTGATGWVSVEIDPDDV